MPDKHGDNRQPVDTTALAGLYANVAQRASRLLARHLEKNALTLPARELAAARSFMDLSARLLTNPYRLAQTQMAVVRDHLVLCQQTLLKTMGLPARAVVTPDCSDRRFRDDAWEEQFLFNFIKQSYLITAGHWYRAIGKAEGLSKADRRRVEWLTRQAIDALSPSNFVLTNPEVLRETVHRRGKNLLKGLKRLLADLQSDAGWAPFLASAGRSPRFGTGLAGTPGQVVFQNALLQLIQYRPTTDRHYRTPVLLLPAWTSRYYLFDLSAEDSFVRWLNAQGFTTFVVSWVNPGDDLAALSFADYVFDGSLAAIAAVQQATGAPQVHLAAYGHGGTLSMATLAYMAAQGDERVASATFLATALDFADDDGVGAATDEAQEPTTERADRPASSALRRTHDLIWSWVVDKYLLANEAFPVDLFYWNADVPRVTDGMRAFCRKHFFGGNRLLEPGELQLAGVPIDVRRIEVPCYVLSTREDPVAPWPQMYDAARLLGGPVQFVLGGAGHALGVINPPARNRYAYWTSDVYPASADELLAGATRHVGSWWPNWRQWLLAQPSGDASQPARFPGDGALPVIEDAPGRYAAGGD